MIPENEVDCESELAVTRWLAELRSGDDVAAARLWKYLQPRLMAFGRRNVQSMDTACYDEDDVAQSAFHALCHSVRNGKYEDIADRDEIWRLLAMIALNKVRKRVDKNATLRRGGKLSRVDLDGGWDGLLSENVTSEDQAIMQEECERMISALHRDEVKQVALLKVEGYTNDEIAKLMGCTRRSVQRRLDFIRSVWSQELSGR